MNQPQAPKLTDYARVQAYAAGDTIYDSDFLVADPCIFLITDGRVHVTKKYTPLQTETFVCEKGELFGALEVYTGSARVTSASAETDVQVLAFNRADFEKAMTGNLNLALSTIRQLSKMLRQVNARIKKLN